MVIQSLEDMFKKASRGNPEEEMKIHLKQIGALEAGMDRAQDLAHKGLISEEKLANTIRQITKQKKAHEAEVMKLSDREAYARKIQRLKETWEPVVQGSAVYMLGFYADEDELVQVGENEYERIPANDQWLQDGAEFRRAKYIELGVKVILGPDGPHIELNRDEIFVGSETIWTTKDARSQASRACFPANFRR